MEALVKLLEGAEDAYVAKGALGCISALVNGNPVNKQAVREANGVQGLVKLLASNPADKDVLRMTAQALKQMTAERYLPYLSFGRHVAAARSEEWKRHLAVEETNACRASLPLSMGSSMAGGP